ncbi:nucleoporin Nup120/160-domain-containing protein [Apodospora peruviana]|uniref:Nucleoporin Nup120/160-domain-containing protein n=1 Tax=Apodospora peruviana TaxID=516989 RepID=A0AAE0ISA0_9PEZI|nr:nucleoporin Nup120/160-domain-containing protein [Apodospora peruviana]
MSAREFEILYKETRLNLEPASPSAIVQIRVSPQSSYGRSIASSRTTHVADDEKGYRTRNLGTASSIYYRKHHTSPRGFHWRVLEGDTVLSIRAADVCKQRREADAPLILHLRFASPIRISCIAFSDTKEQDALCVYVVDQANQLYTITLRPDHFRKRSASDGGLGDACRTSSPPGFSFKHPHRLVAVNPDQFIVTMHDGGILRFDRNRSHDSMNNGSMWKETIYNVAGWSQSLRGLVPFQRNPTIRYDKINMELAAATSTAVTTMGFEDNAFLFTICLDHRMRVWDINTGQILYTGDVLNATRDPQDVGKWVIDPSQSNLIRIVEKGEGHSLVITFSPVGTGEFKFWSVRANESGSVQVKDCFPEAQLMPPSPSSLDVWTMADFAVSQQGSDPELWTLWKNNTTYRVQTLQVRQHSSAGPFSEGWKSVFVENTIPPVQTSGPCDPVDSTEKWLDLIFFPGRFSRSTLETALAMYEKGLGTYKETSTKGSKSIAESICSVLGSTTTLDRTSSGGIDYEQFRGTNDTQWMRFWRLLLELDKQRGEALSLVLDGKDGMIWVACADSVAAIRLCSGLDRIYHNLQSPKKKDEDVAALVSAGLTFMESFTDSMLQVSKAALRAELYEDSAKSDDDRINSFFEKAGFYRQITDEDCTQVVETLGHNFQMLTPRLYEDLFDLITSASEANSQELREPFTRLGQKVVVRAMQETVELHSQILFSQLILLVHMEYESDSDEEALHTRFDIGSVYRRLIAALRRLEQLRWMAKTELSIAVSKSDRSSIGPGTGSPTAKRGSEDAYSITALQGLTGHLFGLPEGHSQPLLSSIMDLVLDFCAPGSSTVLDTWSLQCWLLKHDRPDLAYELSPFASQDPFSTYVQGRVFLALTDYGTAAIYFRKASIGLSTQIKDNDRHSAGLLDDTEWNLLNSGLSNYYAHIVNLYDRQKAHTHVIEFSRLALQLVRGLGEEAHGTKTEMLSRLFMASTAIGHFDVAHSALLAMEDEAMQKSYLRKLVEKMCETNHNAELISLPFSGLQTKVDDILLEKCKATKDVLHGVPYHQVLYAWRISHNDFRGGAAVLLDRLQKLRQMGDGDKLGTEDALDTQVTRQYLLLINALSCVAPQQAYILEDVESQAQLGHHNSGDGTTVADDVDLENHLDDLAKRLEAEKVAATRRGNQDGDAAARALLAKMRQFSAAVGQQHNQTPRAAGERKLLTLGDLRKQYQQELDRIVAIQNNQFGFAEDDFMDVGA